MMNVLNADEWGEECLYKACHAAITDEGLFTDTSVNERGENEWYWGGLGPPTFEALGQAMYWSTNFWDTPKLKNAGKWT